MKDNIQIIIVILLVASFLGFLIVYEKTHLVAPIQKEVESVKEEISKNDSIFQMVDRKWAEQKIHKQKTEHEMDSLMETLDGKKLTIELMEGIKEKFIKAKKECDRKSVIIDSLTNRYIEDTKKLQTELSDVHLDLIEAEQRIEKLLEREIKIINSYSHKVDSLELKLSEFIDIDDVPTIIVDTDSNRKKKKRSKKNKN